MNQFSNFRFKIKWLFSFFLEIRKGYVKNPYFPGPNSMVPLDSIEMISEVNMLSSVFGTFALHFWVDFTMESFWLNCNRCPCIVLNMNGSWDILIHSFANSLSLPPLGIKVLLSHGLESRAFGSLCGIGRPSSGSFILLPE